MFFKLFWKRKKAEASAEISEKINEFMSTNKGNNIFPSEYAVVETQLLKFKNELNQKQAVFKLEAQQKNDLVTYLAHDLKTPLASIIGYLNLLQEAPELPPEQKAKYIDITLEKGLRLEQLINEFFEISRYNLHSVVLDKTNFNFSMMLEQIVDEFYPILEQYNQIIDFEVPDSVIIFGDSNKLARVFNNILRNASSYGYENSSIVLRIEENAGNIIASISNEGSQINDYQLDKIFEKFYRIDDSRSSKTGNAGLGLAIAKQIVEKHGGMIQAESNAKRTTFTVTLPKGN